MMNTSPDCECGSSARPPFMKDIGILSFLDLLALDKAFPDLIYNSDDEGKSILIDRIEIKLGSHIFEAAAQLGFCTSEYELIYVI